MSNVIFLGLIIVLFVVIVRKQRRDEATRWPERQAEADDGIDREELERAEREVQGMDGDGSGAPKPENPGDDWGPGVPRGPVA